MTKYTGPERREYCTAHSQLNELAKKAVPRWAFLSSLGAMITLSITFMGVNETRLAQIKLESEQHIQSIEASIDKRMLDQQVRYTADVRRFYEIAEANGKILVDLKTDLTRTVVKQDLILKKIKMTE